MTTKYLISILIISSLLATACNKILEEKPDQSLKIPSGIEDMEALLNNSSIMNDLRLGLGEAFSDNIDLPEEVVNARNEYERNIYGWKAPIMPADGTLSEAWSEPYKSIYTCNVVLELAKNLSLNQNNNRLRSVMGRAYFFRAYNYLNLVLTWRGPLTDARRHMLAVPIRTQSDMNANNPISTLADVYSQIESDVLLAISLLPDQTSVKTIPNKSAGYGLATRMYLMTGNYEKVNRYADSVLLGENKLLDYRSLKLSGSYPFPKMNQEVLFHVNGSIPLLAKAVSVGISKFLFDSYLDGDLRKIGFFVKNVDGTVKFKGSYNGSSSIFTGLALDEVYLNQVEALVKLGQLKGAKEKLLGLLNNRYSDDRTKVIEHLDQQAFYSLYKEERRKELVFRDLRWADMQRYYFFDNEWNTFKRKVGGEERVFNTVFFKVPYPENFTVNNPGYIDK
ncbi:MAG: RagB/SusD family nutrient uptake outer membrane protein [Sphingobacterium sp.]|jgi:hypothetical protein|nr:RagB/SusD family nutrient uptake outer membrane protein [Sphingobacterium sp.]